MFGSSLGTARAASKCEQKHIVEQNCPDCGLSSGEAVTGDSAQALDLMLPTLKSATEGFATQFKNGAGVVNYFKAPDFSASKPVTPLVIDIDPKERHQQMWGFGGAMTEACMLNLKRLSPASEDAFMHQVFDPNRGAGFNYLRVPLSANDFSSSDFSLDDTPGNQPDPDLRHFDFSRETELIPYLLQAKKINPELHLMATPWTAPAWMKKPPQLRGGDLNPAYYDAYARYLIRILEEFQRNGVQIDEMSVVNEPLIGWKEFGYYPQMDLDPAGMTVFLRDHFVPLLQKEQKAGKLHTQLLLHDHNWDNAQYVGAMLDDKTIRSVTGGVAFHCYNGTPSTMFSSMASHPDVPIFNTECTGQLKPFQGGADMQWWLKNESLDVVRAGAVGAMGWNLCLDQNGGPRNFGGCRNCRGMVTIDQKQNFTFNEEFDAIAQMSRYVRYGAVRIGSTDSSSQGVSNVAFQNPDGSFVLVMSNRTGAPVTLTVRNDDCETTQVSIPANGAVSLHWGKPDANSSRNAPH
ncbi:MAG: glycoside hydrolase family 30 beta sandwich domain-containing protein [Oligoflexia bacterium]|nr:glycoside hydrolase family 30 beta sandwich domain-containing protein [Oligoflexia bacterium]